MQANPKDELEMKALMDLAHVWSLAAFESERAGSRHQAIELALMYEQAARDAGFTGNVVVATDLANVRMPST